MLRQKFRSKLKTPPQRGWCSALCDAHGFWGQEFRKGSAKGVGGRLQSSEGSTGAVGQVPCSLQMGLSMDLLDDVAAGFFQRETSKRPRWKLQYVL